MSEIQSRLINKLSALEKDVYYCRLDNKSYKEISKYLYITVRQVDCALQRVKHKKIAIESQILEEVQDRIYQEKRISEAIDVNDISIFDLELSVRTENCLIKAEIQTLKDIVVYNQNIGLFKINNLGEKSQNELNYKISNYVFHDGKLKKYKVNI